MCFGFFMGVIIAGGNGILLFLISHVIHKSIERRLTIMEGWVNAKKAAEREES